MANRDDYFALNRAYWDERVATHVGSKFYDLESFKRGQSTIDEQTRAFVGPVAGKTLLHLQCHFGMDTLSWARLGAVATGVDFSEAAIKQARSLSDELAIPARFIEANVYELSDQLDEQFDLVFTSWGTVVWLPDLAGWAQVIAEHLKPGGTFVYIDSHPTMFLLDYRVEDELKIGFDYFNEEPELEDYEASYADPASKHENTRSAQWLHSLGSIINALSEAGLRIERVEEEPVASWKYHALMEQGDEGHWRLPEAYPQIPLKLAIRATKIG